MNKTLINAALVLAFGVTAASAQAANVFVFKNGSSLTPGLNETSWYSMLAQDTNSDGIADTNIYMSMRGTDTSLTTGSFNMDVAHPIAFGTVGYPPHNIGNSIDRDSGFLG